MSEYQYYEFLALDRRLSREDIEELREVSSRARITPTSFVNEYNYGNFKGDEYQFLTDYFDAHVYVANWGTHRFMLRLPKTVVAARELDRYCDEYEFAYRETEHSLILDFNHNDDGGGEWDEGDGWMAALAPVRAELLRGDRRALYLGWLMRVQTQEPAEHEGDEEYEGDEEFDDEGALSEREPPVPPGLGALSPALSSLVEFLDIDEDLLAVAAERSPAESDADDGLAEWIAALADEEKNRLLLDAVRGDDASLGPALLARFRASRPGSDADERMGEGERRTIGELFEAAALRREEREREEAERNAKEEARKEAAAAWARAKYLDELAKRKDATWRRVDNLIEEKRAGSYDEAVSLMADLRDVAARTNDMAKYEARLGELVSRLSKRPALFERLRKAGLLGAGGSDVA